jgi:histidinol-phosphate aminotransferase
MLPVRARQAVTSAPAYVPGARPVGDRRVARLASNELHVELPISWAPTGLRRYPEPTALDLRTALAARFGLVEAQLVASPGSVALCRLLIETVCDPGDEVVFAWRSFEAYPLLTRLAGAVPMEVPLTPTAEHDLVAMAAAVSSRTRLVFVCTPNNPTGTAISLTAFEAFMTAVPSDVLVVLDEAYVEFAEGWNGLRLLASHPNLLVLRTFSKAYGLAGARVGWGACDPALAGLLRSAQVPFAVAQPSIDLAVEALGVDLRPRVREVVERRDALVGWLAARGMTVPAARGNFVWLPVGHRATPMARALADADVLVRPFDGEGLRITVGDETEMAMLTAALEPLLAREMV